MNILYLTQVKSIDDAGGTQVRSMALALARLNHNVNLICNDKQAPEKLGKGAENSVVSVKKLGFSGRFHIFLYPLQLLSYGARYINTSKIDVIYERSSLLPFGFLLSKLFKKPLIIGVQGLQYYEQDSEYRARMMENKPFARRAIDNKVLNTRLAAAILKKITIRAYKSASQIITVTPQIKNLICTYHKIDPNKVIVIPNGADIELFKPIDANKARNILGFQKNAQYVCLVAHLMSTTGAEYLIKSAPLILEKCPDVRFLIVGDGLYKEELMNLARQEGVFDKFIFTGAIPHEDVPMYINASDVCVCPLKGDDERNIREGSSSLKVPEYMACGKPVVAGNTLGNKDLIAGSNAGLVVQVEHPNEVASAIIRLLENKQLSQQLGENGRKAVIERYSWTSIAQRVTQICEEAIKRQK